MSQCCKTCIFAQFERTPSGRIRKDSAGDCKAPEPEVIGLAESMRIPTFHRSGIWPEMGENCDAYQDRK